VAGEVGPGGSTAHEEPPGHLTLDETRHDEQAPATQRRKPAPVRLTSPRETNFTPVTRAYGKR
jgi:hypothetical protein